MYLLFFCAKCVMHINDLFVSIPFSDQKYARSPINSLSFPLRALNSSQVSPTGGEVLFIAKKGGVHL